MKWYLYWLTLITALLGILWYKNRRYYPTRTKKWNAGKSLIEGGLLVMAAAFLPAILAVYGGYWVTQRIERPAYKIGVGFFTSIVMMLMLTNFLELVVLIGVFAIEIVSSTFLEHLREQKEKRGVALILDGKCA
jgi:hypothetical protein